MARRSMIIIGAGIAGLSTGCYAQMNGYETKILEMRDKPGGLCTSWKRKGYTLDYSIHNLAGTSKSSATRKIWDELGALRDTRILDHEELVRVESPDGRSFTVYSDLDRLIDEMKRISPMDTDIIDEYARAVRSISKVDLFNMPMGGWHRSIKMLAHIRSVMKWSGVSMGKFAMRFRDPFLRQAFSVTQYDSPDIPMLVNLAFIAGLDDGDLGWPIGGSLQFARNIERRFLELGGEVRYDNEVSEVIVDDDKAIGVRLLDGSELLADIVISASDGRRTIFGMLEGRYSNDQIQAYYEKGWPVAQEFGLQIALGVKRDLTGEPHSVAILLKRPMVIEGIERNVLNLEIFPERSGLVPEGKGVIKVVLRSNYDYWAGLKREGRYDLVKSEVARDIIERLEDRFPKITEDIEVADVSTPLSAERYTGNFRGLQAWMPKEGMTKVLKNGLSKTLPGLSNFYMVGQWSMATLGVGTAAISGRKMIEKICKEDRRRFSSSLAE